MIGYKLQCYWEVLLPVILSIFIYTLLFDKIYNLSQKQTGKGDKIKDKTDALNSLVLSGIFILFVLFFSFIVGLIASFISNR